MMEQGETGNREPKDELRKRRITLPDGRYLIFFTVGEDEDARGERGTESGVSVEGASREQEERRV